MFLSKYLGVPQMSNHKGKGKGAEDDSNPLETHSVGS